MDRWALLLLLLMLATSLVPSLAALREYSITLLPRNYTDLRSVENFTCGTDPGVDADRLLAEANTAYIFDVIDNTEDVDEFYRTDVFDVISFSHSGEPKQITNEDKFHGETGLFTLFIVPSRLQCNSLTFKDGVSAGRGYYPVFIGFTNVLRETTILDRFKADAQVLKNHYSPRNELPKLCGSFTPMLPMNSVVAVLRTNSLTQVFNYLYNEDRDAGSFKPSPSSKCRTIVETEQSLATIMNSDGIHFENTEHLANESDSFLKINLVRGETSKKGVVFIETIDQSADETDFVKYKGPVVFSEGSNTTSYVMRIKHDMDTTNETFALKIMNRHKRKKRAADEITVVLQPKYLPTFSLHLRDFSRLEKGNTPIEYEFPLTTTHEFIMESALGEHQSFYGNEIKQYKNKFSTNGIIKKAKGIDPEEVFNAAIFMLNDLASVYTTNKGRNNKVEEDNFLVSITFYDKVVAKLTYDLSADKPGVKPGPGLVTAWAKEQVGEKFGAERKLDFDKKPVPWEEADVHELQMRIYNRGLSKKETKNFPDKFYERFRKRMKSKKILIYELKNKHYIPLNNIGTFKKFLEALEAEGQLMAPQKKKKEQITMDPYFRVDTNFANSGVEKKCSGALGKVYPCRIWIDKDVWEHAWEDGYARTLKVFFLNEPLRVTPTEGAGIKPRPIKLAHPDGRLNKKHTHGPFMVAGRSKVRLAAAFDGKKESHSLNAENHLNEQGKQIIKTNKGLSRDRQTGIANDNLYVRYPTAFYFNEFIQEHS